MIASDGIPMSTFATSADLRKLMPRSGQTVPKSPNNIRCIVLGAQADLEDVPIIDGEPLYYIAAAPE